ncbi:TMEM65 domain-containing protein [Skeletonema marinoi]|uniref:TMEM65 domain-containing protein n=1 Tax=Skeletonema marinoi TaxID=267567 RepID=A0AAD9DJP5_9STRA|nr:TMEM65 domain-containing protein [Skeletonema marinoi]
MGHNTHLISCSRIMQSLALRSHHLVGRRLNIRLKSSVAAAPKKKDDVILPTKEQLHMLAYRAAIPMVGFGFMDNLVMITAGEAIDSTLGVALGISTMTAAGFGQCCSDVAGNLSGGTVDAAVTRMKLQHHGLSENQLDLKISRMYKLLGACVGVVTGCLLGMSCLLFMDTDKADRARKAKELKSIFDHIMTEGRALFNADRATLFMLDEEKHELWSQIATGTKGIIKVHEDEGIAGACLQSGEIINIETAYDDKRFNQEVDGVTGFTTKSVLAIPVKNETGKCIGVIQMNKKDKDDKVTSFGIDDEKLISMMANHVTSFIKIVDG